MECLTKFERCMYRLCRIRCHCVTENANVHSLISRRLLYLEHYFKRRNVGNIVVFPQTSHTSARRLWSSIKRLHTEECLIDFELCIYAPQRVTENANVHASIARRLLYLERYFKRRHVGNIVSFPQTPQTSARRLWSSRKRAILASKLPYFVRLLVLIVSLFEKIRMPLTQLCLAHASGRTLAPIVLKFEHKLPRELDQKCIVFLGYRSKVKVTAVGQKGQKIRVISHASGRTLAPIVLKFSQQGITVYGQVKFVGRVRSSKDELAICEKATVNSCSP